MVLQSLSAFRKGHVNPIMGLLDAICNRLAKVGRKSVIKSGVELFTFKRRLLV